MTKRPALSRVAEGRAARARRVRARAKLGRLKDRSIQKRTLVKYRKHLRLFFQWMLAWCVAQPRTVTEFDGVISKFAECLWQEGERKSVLATTLSAL